MYTNDILKPKSEKEILFLIDELNESSNELLLKSLKIFFLPGIKRALELGADVHIDNEYPLHHASVHGHKDIVKLLLKNGADVHAKDDKALRWASEQGHFNVVELLLKNGADVHALNDFALLWATYYGHKDVEELLLKHMSDH